MAGAGSPPRDVGPGSQTADRRRQRKGRPSAWASDVPRRRAQAGEAGPGAFPAPGVVCRPHAPRRGPSYMRSKNASVPMLFYELGRKSLNLPRRERLERGHDQPPLPRNVIRKTVYPGPCRSNFMIGAYWAFFMRLATKLDARGPPPSRCANSRSSPGRGWGSKTTMAPPHGANQVPLKMGLAVHRRSDDLHVPVGSTWSLGGLPADPTRRR
jgi:hypothetical protein